MADFRVPDTSGTGGGSSGANGAIVGDNATPYTWAILGSGDSLSTGDLSAADTGEFGNLTEATVEGWFNFFALPNNVPIWFGPQVSGGGSQWAIYGPAGGGTVVFIASNAGGTGISSNSLPISLGNGAANGWYHIVGTVLGGNVYVAVNGVVTTGVSFGGSNFPNPTFAAGTAAMQIANFQGYVSDFATYRVGMSAARIQAHYTAGRSRGWYRQGPGERIIAVLDAVSSHAPRTIQAGTRNVIPRYMSGQAPLDEAERAVEAEDVDAALFAKADGTVTFLADGHRSSAPYNTVQALYGDGGGSELGYLDLTLDYSDSFIVNEWNATRSAYGISDAALQTVSDSASISAYKKRSQSLSDIPVTTDADALTIITALLAKFKAAFTRVTSLTPKMATADVCDATLALELMDRIEVKRRPPGGGSAIDQTLFVQNIKISVEPGLPPSYTLGVTPL